MYRLYIPLLLLKLVLTVQKLVPTQDYYDFQEEHRSNVLNALSRKYHAIGPLLVKVEGLVVQSNTGKCQRLAHYYEHWEAKVFQALVKVSRMSNDR